MSELLFHYGLAFPWVLAALIGFVTWLRTDRARPAPSWRPIERSSGDVVLDGRIQATRRLPGGHAIGVDGSTASGCVLRLADGSSLPLVGRLRPLAWVPRNDDDAPHPSPIAAGRRVRVRASVVPAPPSSEASSGYRETTRTLQLVPREEADSIEIARRGRSHAWALSMVGGLALGLSLPGVGPSIGQPDLGFASPLFRDDAIVSASERVEARLRSGDPDAARDVVKYLVLREARALPACPDEPPVGATLAAIRRLGELCRRPDWLADAVAVHWRTLGPEEARAWLRVLDAEARVPHALVPLALRLRLTEEAHAEGSPPGEPPIDTRHALDERLPDSVRRATLVDPDFARFARGEPEALAPTLTHPFEVPASYRGHGLQLPWSGTTLGAPAAFRLAALALARCGTERAQPACEKAFDGVDALLAHQAGFSEQQRRDLLRFGPLLSEVARRTANGPLDPRVEHLLLERATAFQMLVREEDEPWIAELRAARRRLDALSRLEIARVQSVALKRECARDGRCEVRIRELRAPLLAQTAVWMGSRAMLDAVTEPEDEWRRWLDDRELPHAAWLHVARESEALSYLDAQDLVVAARLRTPDAPRRCATDETLPEPLDLLRLLDSGRVRRARCGPSPEHDRWIRTLAEAYRDETRGPRLARVEAAFVGLAPQTPERELPPPAPSTETTRVMEHKPDVRSRGVRAGVPGGLR